LPLTRCGYWLGGYYEQPSRNASPGFYFSNCDISQVEKTKPGFENPSRIRQNDQPPTWLKKHGFKPPS
jgi:hypothetical protein